MISLKQSMDVLDRAHLRAQVSLDSYVRVLLALEQAAEVMAGEGGHHLREDLKGLLLRLNAETPPRVIQQTSQQSEKAIGKLAELINRKELEYKQIIRIVAEAGASMVESGSAHGEQIRKYASQIDSVSRLDSISEIRHQLAMRVSELKEAAIRIQEEGRMKASKLETEIQEIRQKLKVAETSALTDALTAVGNRRMAEEAMQAAITSKVPFSLIVFDVNGFKQINDTYGHAQGDQLLKAIAGQIKKSVRDTDVVCRWGGDEFLVLLEDTPLKAAEDTAKRIENDAFGEFVLGRAGENFRVKVTANSGTAQYAAGETPVEFFERADRILYQKKTRRQSADSAPLKS